MNERIKSLEGRVRRVQTFLKTTPIVIQKVSSSKATSSLNTSIHNDDQGNNSSLPSDARASNKEKVKILDDSSSSYVLYD
jgi:hypothetical protein